MSHDLGTQKVAKFIKFGFGKWDPGDFRKIQVDEMLFHLAKYLEYG